MERDCGSVGRTGLQGGVPMHHMLVSSAECSEHHTVKVCTVEMSQVFSFPKCFLILG